MKIYWDLFFEYFSNQQIIRQNHNPIREYEDELIEGAIVDIGCGQSPFLLDFAHLGKEIIAIDSEQFQLDYLKQRLEMLDSSKVKDWSFLALNFPQDKLPDKKYSLLIFSNLLHFFSLDKCIEIGQYLSEITKKGALIYIRVHSDKYYTNNPEDPERHHYFKHYFTLDDLEQIFPKQEFEMIYHAETNKIRSELEKKFFSEWIDIVFEGESLSTIELIKEDYMQERNLSNINAIFRRKSRMQIITSTPEIEKRIQESWDRILTNSDKSLREIMENVPLIATDEIKVKEIYYDPVVFEKAYSPSFGGVKGSISYVGAKFHLVVLNISNINSYGLNDDEFDGAFSHELGHIFNEPPQPNYPQLTNNPMVIVQIDALKAQFEVEKELYADSFSKNTGTWSGLLSSINKYVASTGTNSMWQQRIQMLNSSTELIGNIKPII